MVCAIMMQNSPSMTATSPIESLIFTIRGIRVILDSDLASLYEVQTKVLNQALKRNLRRFPEDFLLKLSRSEWDNLKSQNVTSSTHGGRRTLPYAFTEHGAIMVANILRSDEAEKMSVYVVRAFIKQRELLMAKSQTLNRLAPPKSPTRRKAGFHP